MGNEASLLLQSATADQQTQMIRDSFPDLQCLRCKHDDFYILPNLVKYEGIAVVTLVCSRCGIIEQHQLGILSNASKPIKVGRDG